MNLVQTDFQGQGINALNQGLGIGNAFQKRKQMEIDRQRQAQLDAQNQQMFEGKMGIMGQQSQMNQQAIDEQDKAKGMGQLVTALNLPFEKRQEFFTDIESTAANPDVKRTMEHMRTLDDRGQVEFMLQVLDSVKGQKGESNKQKGEKGMVFNPNTGKFSIDPVYAENQKQIYEMELAQKRKLNKLENDKKLAEKRLTGIAEQERLDITDGLNAAESLPILKRADKLLDIVETGKPRQLQLWAKKWFGVEGANEVELDQLLGKQILKQLKPVFGSQFTEGEGRWLTEMEANYGKSTEGNRALIRQGMDLVKRRINLGLDAAKFAGDERVVKNINDWQQWEFNDNPQAELKTTQRDLSDDDIVNKYLGGN